MGTLALVQFDVHMGPSLEEIQASYDSQKLGGTPLPVMFFGHYPGMSGGISLGQSVIGPVFDFGPGDQADMLQLTLWVPGNRVSGPYNPHEGVGCLELQFV